eukprot:Clim_evm84s207 gene=Clim_evmTU84s207
MGNEQGRPDREDGAFPSKEKLDKEVKKAKVKSSGRKLTCSGLGLTVLDPSYVEDERLRVLELEDNKLTTLPYEIGFMEDLEELYLQRNKLVSLPPAIGSVTNLTILNVANNKLQDLPEEIGELVHLSVLNAASNLLISLPSAIGNCRSLQFVSLENNQLSSLPYALCKLKVLETLDVNGNPLDTLDFVPANSKAVPILTKLNEFFDKNPSLRDGKPQHDLDWNSEDEGHPAGNGEWDENDAIMTNELYPAYEEPSKESADLKILAQQPQLHTTRVGQAMMTPAEAKAARKREKLREAQGREMEESRRRYIEAMEAGGGHAEPASASAENEEVLQQEAVAAIVDEQLYGDHPANIRESLKSARSIDHNDSDAVKRSLRSRDISLKDDPKMDNVYGNSKFTDNVFAEG